MTSPETDMQNLMGDLSVQSEIDKILREWPKNSEGDYICSKEKPMEKWMPKETKPARWEHDDVHETDYDGDYSIEYKCHSCGHIWRSEMPE